MLTAGNIALCVCINNYGRGLVPGTHHKALVMYTISNLPVNAFHTLNATIISDY